MDKEQTKKKKRSKREKAKKQMTQANKQITRTDRTKTKYGGSCIESNRFVSLVKDIVASKIILLALTFSNGDPYRSSVHKDFES